MVVSLREFRVGGDYAATTARRQGGGRGRAKQCPRQKQTSASRFRSRSFERANSGLAAWPSRGTFLTYRRGLQPRRKVELRIRILGLAGLIGIGACSQTGNGREHYACQGRYEAEFEGTRISSESASFGIEIKEYNLPWGKGAYINISRTSNVFDPKDKTIDFFYTKDNKNTELLKTGYITKIESGIDSEKRWGQIIIIDKLALNVHYTNRSGSINEDFNGNCVSIK